MDLNLFNAEDDSQSSAFASNLKQATYNPLIITFNTIVTGSAEGSKKDDGYRDNRGNRDNRDNRYNTDDDYRYNRGNRGNTANQRNNPQRINILTQKMIPSSEDVVDLDAEQRRTQYSSCDYIIYVPTSVEISKEKVDAFYESTPTQQFKKRVGKLNLKEAAVSVFMQWNLFQKFMTEMDKPARQRMITFIKQSFDLAISKKQLILDEMKGVSDLHDLAAAPKDVDVTDSERFVILYTTPVSTGNPITTANSLPYLPHASKFNPSSAPVFGFGLTSAAGDLNLIVSQKALTYYYNYFQWVY